VFSLNPTLADIEVPEPGSLLEAARGGDARAFGELCRVYETRLLRHAMGLCGNASLAEELAQDTLVAAWKSLRGYNGRCQFFTWLCAILLNRYRNTLREKRPLPLTALGRSDQVLYEDYLGALADPAAGPDQTAQSREQAVLVRNCLAALPPKLEQVIYLRFYVDDSLEEIAGALGCPVGTVKSRLFNALEKLREMNALGAHLEHFKTKGGP
jgi:RNA polymerase sigma-70 factor (ECF subfamily)